LGSATFLGRGFTFYNPIARTPYTTHWSFNTQSVLPGQFLLEVGYVGSKTVKLRTPREIDGLPNQYLSTSLQRDQNTINFLTANIPNPFAGLLPGTSLNGSTIQRQQLLRPYPQFASISMRDYQGYSWYNSLQVRLERRFSRGFTTLVGYSLSKKMDATEYLNPSDPLPYRTISAMDRPHQLSFSAIYELPFGKGRQFASGINRLGDALIGGWQIGSVYQYNSGFPIGFGNALFAGDVKNIALPRGERTVDRWFNTDAGFVKSTAQQLQFNLRTFPLRFSGVRTGAYNSWDLSLLKNVRVFETHQFQLRGEFYNAFNHPSAWDGPVTSPTSTAFGQITGMLSLPRLIQFGAKYIF
jgi:hypothetical protein